MRFPEKEIPYTKLSLDMMFRYDPATGNLIRKVGRQGSPEGSVVGYKSKLGRMIGIDGGSWRADRVVWIMHFNVDPMSLRHLNGNIFDDRIENLEYVPHPKPVKKVKVKKVPEGNQWWKTFEGVE